MPIVGAQGPKIVPKPTNRDADISFVMIVLSLKIWTHIGATVFHPNLH